MRPGINSQLELFLPADFSVASLLSQFNVYFYKTELPDPFAKIMVDGSGQCHFTEPQKSTLEPQWNQHFDL